MGVAYYHAAAKRAAQRVECTRAHIGAVIVVAGRVVATGYNAPPVSSGLSCLRGDCPRGRLSHDALPVRSAYTDNGYCIAVHAERRALAHFEGLVSLAQKWPEDMFREPLWTRRLPYPVNMYCTHTPCPECREKLSFIGMNVRTEGDV